MWEPIDFFCNSGIIERNENKKERFHGDVLDFNPECGQFFLEIGMHCLGCPSARGESIEMACAVHGTDADALIEKINAFLASAK